MTVNGYYCRNCADVELAKRHLDPAKPNRADTRGAVNMPQPADADPKLGVNRARPGLARGGRIDLRA